MRIPVTCSVCGTTRKIEWEPSEEKDSPEGEASSSAGTELPRADTTPEDAPETAAVTQDLSAEGGGDAPETAAATMALSTEEMDAVTSAAAPPEEAAPTAARKPIICPICEHEVPMPAEEDLAKAHRALGRQRMQSFLAFFFLGLSAALFFVRGWLIEDDPDNPMLQQGLLIAIGVTLVIGLVVTITHEMKRVDYFY